MPWDDTARKQHNRDQLRYPSDLSDMEWAVVAPLIPPAKAGGRPRTTDMREVMNAILYIAAGGCPRRMLPKDFPPASTVRGYFYGWRNDGLWLTINHVLVMSTRELEGREVSPTAGVIDSQSVKTIESGGISGYDPPSQRCYASPAGQRARKIKGRKRHIITDTLGLMLFVIVHAADVQARDGAPDLVNTIRFRFPWLRHIFADGGSSGKKLKTAFKDHGDWTIEIIKRSDLAKGFAILPRRWVVERTFAWPGCCRRLAKDWERAIESSTVWADIASIRVMIRRHATYCYVS